MTIALLRVAAACGALVLLGTSLLPRRAAGPFSAGWLSCRMAVGLAAAIPLVSVSGALGLPLTGASMLAIILLPSAVALLLRRNGRRSSDPVPSRRVTPCFLLTLSATALFVWKVILAPLWSWDHFAIWGLKSRRMVQDGALSLGFLSEPAFAYAHPNYPLGLPVSWRIFSLGAIPDDTTVKIVHVLFAVALAAAFHRLLIVAGLSDGPAEAWTSAVVISPLFWDTESMGNAEVALALFALVVLTLLLDPCLSRAPGFAAGITAGALAWTKIEGLILCALILAAFAAARWRNEARKSAVYGQIAGVGASLLLLAGFTALRVPRAANFLAGDWMGRLADRLGAPGPLLLAAVKTLTHPDWLGAWLLFAAAAALALRRRARAAVTLSAIVAGQTLFYGFTYFATFLTPVDHVRASFHRIMAALLPIALAATAITFSGRSRPDPLERDGAARF